MYSHTYLSPQNADPNALSNNAGSFCRSKNLHHTGKMAQQHQGNLSFGARAGNPYFEGILEYCGQDFAAFRHTLVFVNRLSNIPPASPKGVRGEDLGCKIEILFD
ncbi:hypothetical protein DPMN_139867 [Dreissena polymorpha]|uniref:Uncharacterized protein n=1 Tax=Dreissena polymorpha TaxID=45954 RepID=A0A9D4GCF8_DREPO|nr:hypothetical protein DPMN_139867 [Dreissena polymorpha]